jgi:PAP2 superfamily
MTSCSFKSFVHHKPKPECPKRTDMCCQPISSFYMQKECPCEKVTEEDPFMITNLRLIDIPPVVNSTLRAGGNVARFYIGDDFTTVTYSWKAMTKSTPMTFVTGNGTSSVTNGGEFQIIVPPGTTDFHLTVHMPTVDLILITPEHSPMLALSDSDLKLYMMMKYANKVAIDTSGLDHTPVDVMTEPTRVLGHQLGPHRSSRAMAIVHIAIMDALIAIFGGYTQKYYIGSNSTASPEAAIAQAMYDTLIYLFPSHNPRLSNIFITMLETVPDSPAKTAGLALGAASAAATISARSGDGSAYAEETVADYIAANGAPTFGQWTDDLGKPALGWKWADNVTPFVLPPPPGSISFPDPPAFNSAEYAVAFNQVKSIGGDGTTTPTARSEWETQTGIYWAYDGTPSLCAPPRLYNQIATKVLSEHMSTFMRFAQSLTLVNVAMADAAIYAWHWKYAHKIWRPTTAIRDPTTNTVNSNTHTDATWTAYGAPHPSSTNFVPPFPAYPSGHSTFGSSLFQVLRTFVGDVPFTFTSDELNGEISGRDLAPRSFISLSQAEDENGYSRLPLGIHFVFDKTSGYTLGREVADGVLSNIYTEL